MYPFRGQISHRTVAPPMSPPSSLPPMATHSEGGSAGPSPTAAVTPTSASTVFTPDSAGCPRLVSAKPEPDDASSVSSVAPSCLPPRKKQRRNKPTLSCQECVDRKTKCDRGRPHCLACIKRQTKCQYAAVADLLEETTRSVSKNGKRITKPPKTKRLSISEEGPATGEERPTAPNLADRSALTGASASSGSVASSMGLFTGKAVTGAATSNVFGLYSEHPFANYWTCEGGLNEVVNCLPEKVQADMLLAQYFDCVDPVYPMIHRQTFEDLYDAFWARNQYEKSRADPFLVALIFVMLALGTQFVPVNHQKDRKQTAEFYASAGFQALRVGSFLNCASLESLQAMVLICYFLINDNHASDGWAFAGISMRQAYAMGLHRDPNIVTPHATALEKQQRRKLWQAVLLQDTFLTVLLSLPPSATHSDVNMDDFEDDDPSDVTAAAPTDAAYIRGSWTLANLVQEAICSPRSLDIPICSTQRQKSKLVSEFRAVYRSFPDIFRCWNKDTIAETVIANKRVVRQTLFLTSNYYHNLMLVHASESPDVPVNVRATLEAAHQALNAFFILFTHFENDARVWWVFNHRAFLEALCIGSVLREVANDPSTPADSLTREPLFTTAKVDIARMIRILTSMGAGPQGSEIALTRVEVLNEYM